VFTSFTNAFVPLNTTPWPPLLRGKGGQGGCWFASLTDDFVLRKEFKSGLIKTADLKKGRFAFTCQWKPDKLWDIHTPQNQYDLQLSLLNGEGNALDVFTPMRFGFREFWIDGRDFRLNGTRIFCFAVPFDNALLGAA